MSGQVLVVAMFQDTVLHVNQVKMVLIKIYFNHSQGYGSWADLDFSIEHFIIQKAALSLTALLLH